MRKSFCRANIEAVLGLVVLLGLVSFLFIAILSISMDSSAVYNDRLHIYQPKGSSFHFYREYPQDTVVVGDRDFTTWMQEIHEYTKAFEGKKIEITGFVFKDAELEPHQFVTARFMVTDSIADARVVGILCAYAGAYELKRNAWVKVTGKIREVEYQGETMPVVEVEAVEEISKPEKEYVYPS